MTTTPPAATLFDVAPLQPLLAQGCLLLTPNRRLASRMRAALAAAGDRAAMAGRPVLALTDWLDDLWQQGGFCGLDGCGDWVLDGAQERVLWERVIRASEVGQQLLRPAQAAELAADALRTLVLWRQWPLHAGQRGYFSDIDATCFLDWLDAFRRLCREQGCITAAERDQRVIEAVLRGELPIARPVAQVCFDELPPLHADLFAHIHATVATIPPRNAQARAIACDSFEQQIRAAARWLRAELQHSAGPFALVVPDLGAQRQLVERILLDELCPEHVLPGRPRQLPPVNFSAGEPLADTPIIAAALRVLALPLPSQARADVIALLQSPFLHAHAADLVSSAITEVCALLTDSISGEQLRAIAAALAERHGGWWLDRALQQLADHWRRQRLAQARLPLSQWAEHFHAVLQAVGWPGARTLDSIEYQQVSQWQLLLAGLARFDGVCGPLPYAAALVQLRQLAQAQVFQPKTPDAPMQVLGLLEAAGLQFEGTWLCDMGDDRWPPPAAPHPLLPRDWQRRLRMPHCDAEREFAIAQRLGESLRANARQFVVSYQRERDDVERHISPLFAGIAVDATAAPVPIEPFVPAVLEALVPAPLAAFAPSDALPLDLSQRARGGSAVLADQGACPFRAFARHRLRAEPLGEPQTGLGASERGTLLHAALQSLWLTFGGSAVLRATDETQRQRHADDAARHAISQLPDQQRFGARFLDLERQRLARVLVQWLDQELARADIEIVALEDERQFNFAGLDLRLRVDRIERMPDGRVAIVDYKSGRSNADHHWLGERPEQPQLPLYALALEHEQPGSVAGVLFAQVRIDTPRWIGLGDGGLGAHALSDASEVAAMDWPALLAHWRDALQRIAGEYIGGRATVDPATHKTCDFCALAAVCRIDHAQMNTVDEDA
jgi:probable DNA repair protein